jgi:hypothetical protein
VRTRNVSIHGAHNGSLTFADSDSSISVSRAGGIRKTFTQILHKSVDADLASICCYADKLASNPIRRWILRPRGRTCAAGQQFFDSSSPYVPDRLHLPVAVRAQGAWIETAEASGSSISSPPGASIGTSMATPPSPARPSR